MFTEESGFPQRSVFVLDTTGTVRWAYHARLDEQRDVHQIFAALEEIQKAG